MIRDKAQHSTVIIGAAIIILWISLVPGLQSKVCSEEPGDVAILAVTEVLEEGSEATPKEIPPEKVEEATMLTKERIYGLIAFWVFIIIAAFLVRYQLRDDERLYREGYYKK
jgi:hypothetical protein